MLRKLIEVTGGVEGKPARNRMEHATYSKSFHGRMFGLWREFSLVKVRYAWSQLVKNWHRVPPSSRDALCISPKIVSPRRYTMPKRFQKPKYSSPLSEAASDLSECVRAKFNFNEIRDWQSQAFDRLVHGDDIMVRAGTGSGKSLVFQGMALSKPKAIVLVISPLISLMQDQVIISPRYKLKMRRLMIAQKLG